MLTEHFAFFFFLFMRCYISPVEYVKNYYTIAIHITNNKILDWSKFKRFADDTLIFAQMARLSYVQCKTLWKKEKMLVSSIFSVSQNVL